MAEQSSLAKKIIKGTAVVLFFYLFWKFGGFLVNTIIGSIYPPGTGPAADACTFVYKTVIFTFIYSSALKVLLPAFMPVFIDKLSKDGESSAWEFVYSVFNIVLIISIVVSGIGIVAAEFIVDLLVPGFKPPAKELSVTLLRIMLPGSVGLVLSMVMMSLFNSYKVFSFPAAADAAQKLVWAAAIFLGAKLLHLDARTLAYGFLVGCIVQLLINAFGMRGKRRLYRPFISTPRPKRLFTELAIAGAFGAAFVGATIMAKPTVMALSHHVSWLGTQAKIDQAVRFSVFTLGLVLVCGYSLLLTLRVRGKTSAAARFAALAAPLLIGVVFARYRDIVTWLFQSYTETGVFAAVEFAKNVGNLPVVLVAYGLSVAMFPYLCELASGKDLATFGTLVTRAIRMIALFFIPMSIAMIVLDRPIIALIYDRGNWTDVHIGYAAMALSLFVFALFFYAIENVLMQAFFSVQRMWTPTFLGIVASVVQVIILTVGINVLGYNTPYDIFLAVSIAYPITRIMKEVALLLILRRHVPILPVRETAVFFAKLAAVCVAFGVTMHCTYRVMDDRLPIGNYKKGDVILDTFNAETKDWISRDAEAMRIVDEGGRQALCVRYRPLARREVAIERDLSQFRLEGMAQMTFWCKASAPETLRVELTAGRRKWSSEPLQAGTDWRRLAVDVPAMDRIHSLSLEIRRGKGGEPRQLFVDDIRFTPAAGSEVIVDHFGQPSPAWTAEGEPLTVSEVGEGAEERALVLADGGRNIVATRLVTGYDLQGTEKLRVKVKSNAAGKLQVVYLRPGSDSTTYSSMGIKASEERKTYEISLMDDGTNLKSEWLLNPFASHKYYLVDPAKLEGVQFRFASDAGEPAKVWLDNVTFVAHKGFMGLSPKYEIVKVLCVGVPCLLGGIVLIAFIFILRIEEGRMILDWTLEQGRAKLSARRGKRTPAANKEQ